MTTSSLVGPDSRSSFQDTNDTFVAQADLIGATQRISAYNRLKRWLRLSPEKASEASYAFQQAVKTMPPEEQLKIVNAEMDALRHGFSFADFQKLKHLALKSLEDPFLAAACDETEPDPYYIASMLANSN